VPAGAARFLGARGLPVLPPAEALEVAQDRLAEKTLFRRLDIAVPEFAAVDDLGGLWSTIADTGLPAVLKTRRGGYDGKGQAVLREPGDVEPAWRALCDRAPLLVESLVGFERELSILAARSRAGETAFWPLVENVHRDGILRLSTAPALRAEGALDREAAAVATKTLQALDYVGVLAIELFQHEGRLLANEMAPRVHNSGHWTIEGAITSQFENHLRAVLDLPLGVTSASGASAMVNLIGRTPDTAAILDIEGAHLHLYGKPARPGRKLGHVTLVRPDHAAVESALARVAALVDEPSLVR
jgi:5-(carboxyamino)imidazole ribonucleotide synthase